MIGEVNKHVILGPAAKRKTTSSEGKKKKKRDSCCSDLSTGKMRHHHRSTSPFITYLFNTFPEPPLTWEESPFSTARKFSGVTACKRTRKVLNVNIRLEKQKCAFNIKVYLHKQQNTDSSTIKEKDLICTLVQIFALKYSRRRCSL